jgi:hypothetical protein
MFVINPNINKPVEKVEEKKPKKPTFIGSIVKKVKSWFK